MYLFNFQKEQTIYFHLIFCIEIFFLYELNVLMIPTSLAYYSEYLFFFSIPHFNLLSNLAVLPFRPPSLFW